MQKKNKVSKITKVLIKDLKGERIVYHDTEKEKIVIPETEKDNAHYIKKDNQTWELIWRTLLIIFLIDFSIFSYFKFYKKIGVIEGLNELVVSTRNLIDGKEKEKIEPIYRAKIIEQVPIKNNYRKKIIHKKHKDDELYTWKDTSGKQHYSNLSGSASRKNVAIKKLHNLDYLKNSDIEEKVIKYILYLDNGGSVEGQSITKNENIIILSTRNGMLMNFDKNKIDRIEKYIKVNDNIKMKKWVP